jgi:hypothetical protein
MNKPTTDPKPKFDATRELLRHTLATVAYRGGKAVRNAPAGFADFHAGEGVRTPGEILAHIGDLMDWALSIAMGNQKWATARPQAWDKEVERFFTSLTKFDDFLASDETLHVAPDKLLQGPAADALTHVGQIVMLRRLAGSSMKSENYFIADIEKGRVGADQAKPKQEF